MMSLVHAGQVLSLQSSLLCASHAQVHAIQFGLNMPYTSYVCYVVGVVSIIITSCPESFHILQHADCLAAYPGGG